MQLHLLEMTAIGPFAGTERVDFATIGRAGLFLLEGPTGSGKSTIIDAITFGLYGRLAQAGADLERIHSHHADPRTVPVVTVVFETQSGIYRVRRTPRFERPKSRGTGTTVQQPSVKLWRLASVDDLEAGELLSTNIGDCDDEITRAVGLTRDQFVQTVILPQGEFATFLRARSEDKGRLLEKVFGTAFFRQVQEQLVEAGRAAQARRQHGIDEIHDAVQAFAVSAGLADERRAALVELGESRPDDLLTELAEVVDELRTRERHARKVSREAIDRHSQMADMVGDARLRMHRRERLLELQRREEDLERQATEVRQSREQLARAVRARPVAGAIRALTQAEATLERAEAAHAAARGHVAARLRDHEVSALRAEAATLREVTGSLQGALELESALASHQEQARGVARAAERHRATLEGVRVELVDLPRLVREQDEALGEARRLHALHEARSAATGQATDRLAAALDHEAAAARLPGLQRAVTTALTAVRAAEGELGRLRQARIDGIAGELGLTLVAGDPCPVCGGTEHPAPARPSSTAVTPEQVQAQELALERLRSAATARADDLGAGRTEVGELAARCNGLTVVAAREAAELAGQQLAESIRAGATLRTGTARLEALRGREQELGEQSTALATELARLDQSRADWTARLAREAAEVARARGDHPTVAERRRATEAAARRVERLADAVTTRDAAGAAVVEASAALDVELAAAEFESVQEWREADRSTDWITDTRQAIADFERERTAVRAALTGPELADVQLDALFDDIEQLVELERAARQEMEQATTEHGSLRSQATRARQRLGDVEAALARNARVTAETADAIRVGQLVAGGGDNRLNLDLAKYVLIRRFAEVLSVANTELAKFSGGRYSLEHTDAKQGNARSGLGIRVHDMHTNQVREVGTLSGGETFYVSLALALALAEVVRAESGGVELGTLFVDEGFGTLDPEVLDDVMHTLEGLREGGRTVGIVSHVTELKSRVADRIEVVVQPDRTSTLLVTA
ncbi:AAA family ATPase [Intrasporangium sp.]|uniref:AAA family ATPase n=1 Tax=Intrasporangium sp. TaxID=1925024 RepID=UPI003221F6E7